MDVGGVRKEGALRGVLSVGLGSLRALGDADFHEKPDRKTKVMAEERFSGLLVSRVKQG